MLRIIPLHDGITDGANAFCSCFSCFRYLARRFWNQTCVQVRGNGIYWSGWVRVRFKDLSSLMCLREWVLKAFWRIFPTPVYSHDNDSKDGLLSWTLILAVIELPAKCFWTHGLKEGTRATTEVVCKKEQKNEMAAETSKSSLAMLSYSPPTRSPLEWCLLLLSRILLHRRRPGRHDEFTRLFNL